ncbi:MFS transporter [Inconstantimicrobium mannanitabidum]|uniref:MFS transporter n=1 Tax=Inconstantimicrobium mannanitabidum TaxID=1604901 RepID=A0ACB5RBG2_9CLOT|nr:MFS transporter [Clostridium sp. TW13]GKX66573.1 MFS transporter [Clostridium sp. TW13]
MKENKFKSFILFWLSQSISELGSSMTSFALIIWAYGKTNSAMSVSLMTFFSYLPYIIVSVFAGAFIDSHSKKKIMLWSDTIAALCSSTVLTLLVMGKLEVWYIYIINGINGFMNSFQSPASMVAVGIIVPEKKYTKASGMNSFSSSLLTFVTPMLAAFVSSFLGLQGVIIIDLSTFIFAVIILTFFISIPEQLMNETDKKDNIFNGCKEGMGFLFKHKGIWYVIISMAFLNFFSRLTYENILSPMILARSSGNSNILGIVSAVLGMGGIAGGLIVSLVKLPNSNAKLIYFSAAFSFAFGDLFMGIGQNVYVWCIAAIAASVPIPFIAAGQNVILYNEIPKEMQGRVFAVRNAVQYCTIPAGIVLGGVLADYVFEPFMLSHNKLAFLLQKVVGNGSGSGMAVMFLCTGILGFITSILWYRNKHIRAL